MPQGGNKCHNPDFLGFSLNKQWFLRGSWWVYVLFYLTKGSGGASQVTRRLPCSAGRLRPRARSRRVGQVFQAGLLASDFYKGLQRRATGAFVIQSCEPDPEGELPMQFGENCKTTKRQKQPKDDARPGVPGRVPGESASVPHLRGGPFEPTPGLVYHNIL